MDSTLALGAFPIARGAGGEGVDVNGNLVEREKGDEFGIETRPGRFSGFRNLLGACRGEEATRNTAGRRRWGIPV